jgi:hypothetical protein
VKRSFFFPATMKAVIEQDVKVTVTEEKDVPIQKGDEVTILMRATVGSAAGAEVELTNMTPVKVTGIIRRKG